MPRRIPTPFAAWAVLSLPLLAVLAACFFCIGGEEAVAAFFAGWRAAHPALLPGVKFYTDWGNPALYLVYAGMLGLGITRGRADLTARALAYLAAQLLVSLALERLLKIGIGRPRPGVGGPFMPWSLDAAHNAMPSGHTAEMTVQTASLAVFSRPLALPLLLGLSLALMGLSRLALGAHHPTDVLGGWALGSLGGPITCWLAPRLAARFAQRSDTKGSL